MKVRETDYYFVALCNPYDELAVDAKYRPRKGDDKPVFVALDILRHTLRWMYRLPSDNPQNLRERKNIEASKISMEDLPRYCEEWIWLEGLDEYDVKRFVFVSRDELYNLSAM